MLYVLTVTFHFCKWKVGRHVSGCILNCIPTYSVVSPRTRSPQLILGPMSFHSCKRLLLDAAPHEHSHEQRQLAAIRWQRRRLGGHHGVGRQPSIRGKDGR